MNPYTLHYRWYIHAKRDDYRTRPQTCTYNVMRVPVCCVDCEMVCSFILLETATVEEDILANDWLKPLSERYNFIDRKDGTTACIADLKAQAIAQGFGSVVRI